MSENQGQVPEGAPESEKEGYQERYDLSVARLKEMQAEDTTAEPFRIFPADGGLCPAAGGDLPADHGRLLAQA